ncbi:MAG: alpha/beta fold hydrolase [Casimicrobiaceae bacterium]
MLDIARAAILPSSPPKPARRAWRMGGGLLALALAAYGALLATLYFTQERLLFPATVLPADHQFRFDVPFTEMRIPVPGASLDALLFTQPEPRGLVFFLHGNAGNLNTWTTGVEFYRRVNYDMFMLDYRGYGRSTGRIESEAELHADVRAAWNAIAPRYAGKPIVIYGRSLGTGLAVQLARDVHPQLLVLVSPYASIVDAAQRRYPFVPSLLVKYPLRTDKIIGDVKSPILFAHGTGDEVIPIEASLQLRALARAPTTMLTIDGATHHDIHRHAGYLEPLAEQLVRATTR